MSKDSFPGQNESQTAMTRWEWLILLMAMVTAFLLKEYCIRFYDVMSADGTGYATMGKNFFTSFDPATFGTVMPPLYPFMIGLFDLLFNDLDKAARTVSVFFHVLTVLPVYLITRQFFDRAAAAIAVMLYLTLPFLQSMAGIDIAEPTYTFFAFAGAYFFWQGFRNSRCWYMFGAGSSFALAYLARPEGFVLLVALSTLYVFLHVRTWREKVGKFISHLLILWLGFFLFAAPYWVLLHQLTGKWQLSGKTAMNTSIIKEYMGKSISDERFQLDKTGEFIKQDGSLLQFMLKEPALFAENIKGNMRNFPTEFNGAIPYYLWPLVLIGFFACPWRGRHLEERLFLVFLASPLLLYVVFYIVNRYFYPYIPILVILTGAGAAKIGTMLPSRRKFTVAVPAMAIVAGYFAYLDYPRPRPTYNYNQDGGRYDDKQVGLRLKQILPQQSVLMTRSGRISFYSQLPFVLPPQAGMDEIIAYARKHQVTHLIVNMQLVGLRPQLMTLFTPLTNPGTTYQPPRGLQLMYAGQEPGGLPYLVYRLVATE